MRLALVLLLCSATAWADDSFEATGRIIYTDQGAQLEVEIFNPPSLNANQIALDAPGIHIPASRVATYAEAGPPIAVAFVICTQELFLGTPDELAKSWPKSEGLERITQGLALARLNHDLPKASQVAVVAYDTGARLVLPLSPIGQFDPEVLGSFDGYKDHVGSELSKGVMLGLDQLEAAHATRKALIVIGDGNETEKSEIAELGRLRERAWKLGIDIWAPVYRSPISYDSVQTELLTDATRTYSAEELANAIPEPFDRLRNRKFIYFPTTNIPRDGVRRLYALHVGLLDGPVLAFALPKLPGAPATTHKLTWPVAAIGGGLLVLAAVLLFARRRAALFALLLLGTRAHADSEVTGHVVPGDKIEVEVTSFPDASLDQISLETMGMRVPAEERRSYAEAGAPVTIALVMRSRYRILASDALETALQTAQLGLGMPPTSTGFVVEYDDGVRISTPRTPLAKFKLSDAEPLGNVLTDEVDAGIALALDELERGGPRRALVVIGDGTDSLSFATRERLADLAARARKQNVLLLVLMHAVSWEDVLVDYEKLTPNRKEVDSAESLGEALAQPMQALRDREYLYFSTAQLPHDGIAHSYTLHIGERQLGPMLIGLAAPPPLPPASKKWLFVALAGFVLLLSIVIVVRWK